MWYYSNSESLWTMLHPLHSVEHSSHNKYYNRHVPPNQLISGHSTTVLSNCYECRTAYLYSTHYTVLKIQKPVTIASACSKNELLNHLMAIVLQFKLVPPVIQHYVQQYEKCICNQFTYFEKMKVEMIFHIEAMMCPPWINTYAVVRKQRFLHDTWVYNIPSHIIYSNAM